jgi:16S rRNA (uracil1498-N3)-methyltransferase
MLPLAMNAPDPAQHRDEPPAGPRFFCPGGWDAGRPQPLEPEEARHAARVLRLRAGDAVELFDGRGRVAGGRLSTVARNAVEVEILREWRVEPVRPAVHVAFAVPKGKRLDWLLEKATELAATSLTPVRFSRSVAGGESLGETKRQRWRACCVAAAKQCGLSVLPEIRPMRGLAEWLAGGERPPGGAAWLGDPQAGAVSPMEALRAAADPLEELALLIGPEGGLTDAERSESLAAGLTAVRLGATVLRVETACLALLAAVRSAPPRSSP